ncbi:hypothetical protein DFH06DRAFT_914573, partial [Mycena polygramma]
RCCAKQYSSPELENQMKLAKVAYPVLTLPAEIVSCIFVACLPHHGPVRPSPSSAPLLLAQICQYWREITLSSCELWSSVDLFFRGQSNGDRYGPLLKTWLARAKGRPLFLTI